MRYLKRHRGSWLALLICSVALTGLLFPRAGASQPAAVVAGPKLVLAFYYPWYAATNFTKDKMRYLPTTAYNSSDRQTMDSQIQQAKSVGINGFISEYERSDSLVTQNFPKLLDAAHAAGDFYVAPYFNVDLLMANGDIGQQISTLVSTYSSHPAYLKWNGRPVIFFWAADQPKKGFDVNKWRTIRNQVDPNHTQIWSVDTTDKAYLDVFDTVHLFSGGKWEAANSFPNINATWRGYVDAYNKAHPTEPPRLWTADVIPGWDETRLKRGGDFTLIERQDGQVYEASWKSAIAANSNPEWVLITSWNEWFEGTEIEPSADYGNRYLDLTSKWVNTFVPSDCETMNGHKLCGLFRAYWHDHGGLAQQGLPIGEVHTEASLTDKGQSYTVQYFERAVFERHPEHAGTPFEVLLTQLGTYRYQCKYPSGAPDQKVNPTNPRVFPETKHSVGGLFRAYWESHGGLAQQGYPLTDEFTEASDLDPGKSYTVQYFERAVFEQHPENAGTPFEVLLAQLGTYGQRQQLCPK